MRTSDLTYSIRRQIRQHKQELVAEAERDGLWENFGQDRVRAMRTQYCELRYGTPAERHAYAMIEAFDEWCMNYAPSYRG
jgi:hypothetical protein